MRAAPPGETSKQEVEPLARELEAGLQKAEEPDIDSLQEKARKKAIAATEAAQRKGEDASLPLFAAQQRSWFEEEDNQPWRVSCRCGVLEQMPASLGESVSLIVLHLLALVQCRL